MIVKNHIPDIVLLVLLTNIEATSKKSRIKWVKTDSDAESAKKKPTIPHPIGPRPIYFLTDPQRKSKAFSQKKKTVEKKLQEIYIQTGLRAFLIWDTPNDSGGIEFSTGNFSPDAAKSTSKISLPALPRSLKPAPSTTQSIAQSTAQSTEQSTAQSIAPSTAQSPEQSTAQSTSRLSSNTPTCNSTCTEHSELTCTVTNVTYTNPTPTSSISTKCTSITRSRRKRPSSSTISNPKYSQSDACKLCSVEYGIDDDPFPEFWVGCQYDRSECTHWIHINCLGVHFKKKTHLKYMTYYCPAHNRK